MSRCPPPGGLYDGDDEASRVPGKPTRTHATRSDPSEVAASTASEMRRDSLPSNARRRPSQTMHFGAQSRGLRAPWSASDLEDKLVAFQDFYNAHRAHASLDGRTPVPIRKDVARLDRYRWDAHCRGLYQTPIAA